MLSFKSTTFFLAAAIAAVAKADYIIDPDSVDKPIRDNWCQSELDTCPLICYQVSDGAPLVNDCDPDLLTYGCICADGSRPNVSEYTLTLPYFTCIEWGNQCVEGCGSDNGCASSCREDHPCGAQDPERSNATTTSSSTVSSTASTTGDADSVANTKVLGGDDDNDGDSTGNAIALGRSYGLTFVASALFVGFALL